MTAPVPAGQDDLDAPAPRDAPAASDGAPAASRGAPGGSGDGAGPALAPVDRRIFVVAGAVFAVLMAFSARYGFDRDELYFLDCARHLSLSYVDQPVFAPLVARVSLDLFGVSLTGLRLWPSLAAAGTVIAGGLLAREFGGQRAAQFTGAVGVATAPALLGADHILGPTAFDLLSWSALALIVARIGRTGDTRLWLAAGAVLGVGLENKHSIGFFAVALAVGLVASGGRRLITNRWFALGLVIALLFTVPDLWWQAHHGWATIAMTRALAQENGGPANAVVFLVSQSFMAAPVLIGVWLAGLRFLWRSGRPAWRALAWSYGLLVVFFAVTSGAKPYYVAAAYFFLLAAGAVAVEQRWAQTPGRALFASVPLAVCVLITLPIVLPVLPARLAGWTSVVNPVQTETIGWPEFVATVSHVWDGLPAAQRSHAVIFTANYGEAGAVNELGRRDHLPEAVSGHNSLWFWGPGDPRATTVVAIVPGIPKHGVALLVAQLRRDFAQVRVVATLGNTAHVVNQEDGGRVYLCQDPRQPWGQLWPTLRHYG
jgi:4-amino-4-deoxy-L-arabinose transferase-like glycosyltransferase